MGIIREYKKSMEANIIYVFQNICKEEYSFFVWEGNLNIDEINNTEVNGLEPGVSDGY